MDLGRMLRDARRRAGLSQRALAARAGTSGPTVAAYESGRVEPRLSTLQKLLAAAGQRLHIRSEPIAPPLTREERRSLFLHQAVAEEILARPQESLDLARRNLEMMRHASTERVGPWLDSWQHLVDSGDVSAIVSVLTDAIDPEARELRQNSPFAGLLSPRQRWDRLRRFREVDG